MSALGTSGFLAHEDGVDYSVAGGAPNYAYTADAGAEAARRPLARDRILYSIATSRYRLTFAATDLFTLAEIAFMAHDQTLDWNSADVALVFAGSPISGAQLPPTQNADRVYRRSTRLYSASLTLSGYTLPHVAHEAHEANSPLTYGAAVSGQGYLAGTVRDSAGAPLARTVYAIDDLTGRRLGSAVSDAITGAYTIDGVLASARIIAVAVPTLADNRNAVVYDNVTPAT